MLNPDIAIIPEVVKAGFAAESLAAARGAACGVVEGAKGGTPQASPCTSIEACKFREFSDVPGRLKEWKRADKARIGYVKIRTGIEVALLRGRRARQFVLSESPEAVEAGLSFERSVLLFEHRLRYEYGDVSFCWVEHKRDGTALRDRHFIECGERKLDLHWLDDTWKELYRSMVPLSRRARSLIKYPGAEANYCAKYMRHEGFVRARFSHNWVFPGWWKYTSFVHKREGVYPSPGVLAYLAGLPAWKRPIESESYRAFMGSGRAKREWKIYESVFGESESEASARYSAMKRSRTVLYCSAERVGAVL